MKQQLNDPVLSDKAFTWRDGKLWFDAGVKLFKQVKNHWYILCMVLAVVMVLFANISVTFVGFLMVFVSPFVTAFVMNTCQNVEQQQTFTFVSLWSRIFENIQAFLLLGLYAFLLSLFFQQVHIQLLAMFQLPVELTESMMKNMSGRESLLRALLNLVTNLPVALAMAFAPALILFHSAQPHKAVKFSVLGVLKAWKAFTALALLFILMFFGIVMLATLMISIIMAVLGPASQVMINAIVLFFVITVAGIGLCAQYQAFVEIFNTDREPTDNHGTEIYTEI